MTTHVLEEIKYEKFIQVKDCLKLDAFITKFAKEDADAIFKILDRIAQEAYTLGYLDRDAETETNI